MKIIKAKSTDDINNLWGKNVDYEARGCIYEFSEMADNEVQVKACIVTCFNKDGKMVWSGPTIILPGMRVIDCVRSAREAA